VGVLQQDCAVVRAGQYQIVALAFRIQVFVVDHPQVIALAQIVPKTRICSEAKTITITKTFEGKTTMSKTIQTVNARQKTKVKIIRSK
jgi:hypothetical protein